MVFVSTIHNPAVAAVFEQYPEPMRTRLLFLRRLVLDAATETEGVDAVEETLRWGEPSYIAKSGSAVRMDWKATAPRQYAMYFNCKTALVDTFKALYGDLFKYEGNRAIVFDENEEIPIDELKHCIALSLTYRKRKHLPMLGA